MDYTLSVDEQAGVLCVEARGEMTRAEVADMTRAVGEKAREQGLTQFLFDVRETRTSMSFGDAFALAVNPEERGLQRNVRRAIVHTGMDEEYRHFETVSLNHGFIVKVFSDPAQAMEWLADDR
jgi:hypothetical protein